MIKKRVLIPLPNYGFDPTEAAIPWKLMREKDIEIVFITPYEKKASADRLMVSGEKLGVFKSVLQARKDAVNAYLEMEQSEEFCNPLKYNDALETDYDAILLSGGHDKAVREYLESKILQQLIVAFFKAKKPVAAVCHGVVLAARSIDSDTGKSVLHNYKTTSLLKSQELLAYNLTRLWLKDYYLTYPGLTTEDEVRSVLSNQANFIKGPFPLQKDSPEDLKKGFVVRDRNYVSARWPGDIYSFSLEFIKIVQEV